MEGPTSHTGHTGGGSVTEVLILEDGLTFESGAFVAPLEIAYATYGSPSDRVLSIARPLPGGADAAAWWARLIGRAKPIDADRFFVVCANILGGCKGTTG